jgi:hypothetical protein
MDSSITFFQVIEWLHDVDLIRVASVSRRWRALVVSTDPSMSPGYPPPARLEIAHLVFSHTPSTTRHVASVLIDAIVRGDVGVARRISLHPLLSYQPDRMQGADLISMYTRPILSPRCPQPLWFRESERDGIERKKVMAMMYIAESEAQVRVVRFCVDRLREIDPEFLPPRYLECFEWLFSHGVDPYPFRGHLLGDYLERMVTDANSCELMSMLLERLFPPRGIPSVRPPRALFTTIFTSSLLSLCNRGDMKSAALILDLRLAPRGWKKMDVLMLCVLRVLKRVEQGLEMREMKARYPDAIKLLGSLLLHLGTGHVHTWGAVSRRDGERKYISPGPLSFSILYPSEEPPPMTRSSAMRRYGARVPSESHHHAYQVKLDVEHILALHSCGARDALVGFMDSAFLGSSTRHIATGIYL